MQNSALFLLPNDLGTFDLNLFAAALPEVVASLDGLIAESPQRGRSFLNRFRTKKPPYEIPLATLDAKTSVKTLDFFLDPIKRGERWGLISDAGLPSLADPGARLVMRAHQRGIPVEVVMGPSSIVLGLMLSGLPSQRFSFHGYIGKDPGTRKKELKQWQYDSVKEGSTHLFIERPYSVEHTLKQAIEVLSENCWLTFASNLTLPSQEVRTLQIKEWRKRELPKGKTNALFLLHLSDHPYP